MLAKIVNDNAATPGKRGAFAFFASKLAPTGGAFKAIGVPRLCLAEGLCHDDPTAG
ncbi:hypothetical protein GCM10009091_46760 [Pseudomonas brenneri]|nr:hypothetical protein GCM10009091_46760 [Pseudomonas brenneri]